jgi:hypothetical protein
MRRALKVLGVLLVLFLLYTIAVGLGLTNVFKGKKNKVKIEVLNDFERPGQDLYWNTGGYITLESATENQTKGRRSMKATFLLPSQFMPTPTPALAWAPSMKMGFDTVTPLVRKDWSRFTSLNVDVFNNEDRMLNYSLKVDDGKGYSYTWTGSLIPKRVTNIAANLEDMKNARMDLSSIRALSFAVDVTGAAKPVVIYLDYLHLEGPLDGAKPAPKAPPVPVTMNRPPLPTATVPPLPGATPPAK